MILMSHQLGKGFSIGINYRLGISIALTLRLLDLSSQLILPIRSVDRVVKRYSQALNRKGIVNRTCHY